MVKPTLLVLAAGMGSRYGSLKQMDGVGPNNEAIIDYSVYDAIRAGFGKVVFVIRHSFEKEFREVFSADRFGGRIAVDFVFQELDYLPEGLAVPEGRVKPWGTNHAVMMAADAVHEPFAVINAALTIPSVRIPFSLHLRSAARLSAVSPDWLMITARLLVLRAIFR